MTIEDLEAQIKALIERDFAGVVNGLAGACSQYGQTYRLVRVFLPGEAQPDADVAAWALQTVMRSSIEHWSGDTIVWRSAPTLMKQDEIQAGRRLDFDTGQEQDMPRQPAGWYVRMRYHTMRGAA